MPFAPIVGSILAAIAWAVFILVYALFWSGRFNYFQDFIVTIVSLLVVGLLIALMWVVWGARRGWQGRWDSWQSD
jgi:cation transporter-like permease